jgi:putative flippase GtrA
MSKTFIQFIKFAFVGGINTGIDFAVLNSLMWISGIYKGEDIIFFNIIAFTVATINSYFMNKHWTFKAREKKEAGKEFSQFFLISLIGISINTSIVYSITTFIEPSFGLSSPLWANFAKASATVISLVWNFIGYKFIVFKK